MITKQISAERHSILNEVKFHLKSLLLVLRQHVRNGLTPSLIAGRTSHLKDQPVLASSQSDLWNADDTPANWILTAGKVENLRIAVKAINGIEVSANRVFSFWKHIGKPSGIKGYVIGREIREGCIVPTVAGGLCQLSNALYDAALKAGFEIVERHKHTRVIKGSLAEQDRDATVKWNYVDLRFKSSQSFRIEATLTDRQLIVNFRGPEMLVPGNISDITLHPSKLNDCYSCGNSECFKHPNPDVVNKKKAVTTYILDEKWDEFDQYVSNTFSAGDKFIIPVYRSRLIDTTKHNWTIKSSQKPKTFLHLVLAKKMYLRLFKKRNLFESTLKFDKTLALAAAKNIPIESTHLVISQNLLPFIWQQGALGGRTFDVLMTRLPFEKLHERLDIAHAMHKESKTLNDFRVSQELIDIENIALTKARHIITPHAEIASIFTNKVIKLDWLMPDVKEYVKKGNSILFPAAAVGRKGAYEIRKLAHELDLTLVIAGRAVEHADFWNGIKIKSPGKNALEDVKLVLYPTYVEHRPTIILKALAAGIPVITTKACGIDSSENLIIVPIGDYEALRQKVKQLLHDELLWH